MKIEKAVINNKTISILFSNNKIGFIYVNDFLNKPPFYLLKNESILSLMDFDGERLFWGNVDNPIIDIHIDQLIERVVWINEQ